MPILALHPAIFRGTVSAALLRGIVLATAASHAAAAARTERDACGIEAATPVEGAAVRDARTIALGTDRLVRLAGIETLAALLDEAEVADAAMSRRAAEHLAVRRTSLRLRSGVADRRERHAAILFVAGVALQERLVAEGLALVVPDRAAPAECLQRWLAAEATARRAGAGFWAQPQAQIVPADPERLSGRIGRFVIVNGLVLSVGTRRNRTYLNFGTKWSEDVTIEIESQDRDRFGGASALAGRAVRVRGFVEDKAGPMIRLCWPAQIEVLAAEGR